MASSKGSSDFIPLPEDKRLFYVEKVLNRKIIGNQKWYLIKWVGYPSAYNSWESLSNLEPGHENVALIDGNVVRVDNRMARKGVKRLELKVKIRRKKENYRVILNEVDDDMFVKPLPVKKRKYQYHCPDHEKEKPRLSVLRLSSPKAAPVPDFSTFGSDDSTQTASSVSDEVNEDEIAAVRISARNLLGLDQGMDVDVDKDDDCNFITFHAADCTETEMDSGFNPADFNMNSGMFQDLNQNM